MIPTGKEFVKTLLPPAAAVVVRKHCPAWYARWMVAISVHETGWGKHIPGGRHGALDGPGSLGLTSYNICGYMWEKGHGWPYVTASEGTTGDERKFRVFSSLSDCLGSLLYLISRSSHAGYVDARTRYGMTHTALLGLFPGRADLWYNELEETARGLFVRDFSLTYCPMDKDHGRSVLSIYRELEESA